MLLDALLYALAAACFVALFARGNAPGDAFWPWHWVLWRLQTWGVPRWALKPLGLCERCFSFWVALGMIAAWCPWQALPLAFAAPVLYLVAHEITEP